MFEHQADSIFLHQDHAADSPISSLGDYDEYDHADDPVNSSDTNPQHPGTTSHPTPTSTSDGSGMEGNIPEDVPVLLPSSLGWEWCLRHGVQSLAVKEAQLRHAQASDSIHKIRLALGFKSALFRTQVRPANTQQTKTRAWNAIHSVDTTVHEHARIYSMARDAFRKIRHAFPDVLALPQLRIEDLHVATLILGSEKVGQRNKQRSWIWSFGQTTDDDGTWMDDCKLLYSLFHVLIHSYIGQLNGFTGFVQRHSLNDGWKSRTAFTMKLNGFLHIFMPRQRHGRSLWCLLHRDHSKGIKHMHRTKCIRGRGFLEAQ
jgi:hypothetical protein